MLMEMIQNDLEFFQDSEHNNGHRHQNDINLTSDRHKWYQYDVVLILKNLSKEEVSQNVERRDFYLCQRCHFQFLIISFC